LAENSDRGVAMETVSKNQADKKIYDKIQLLRMNDKAFKAGLIDEKVRGEIEKQIWAS
jgi:CRISPR/Cas system CMR-associated protein Cmr3 (group 5 of RAMP superfamily)